MGVTALTQYQRLEAAGVWRPAKDARLKDVVVSVGAATLMLSDPRSDRPLTHWSLPAVVRVNPGKRPAVFAPGGVERDEILEIDDPLMIDAIEKVHRAIESHRPHPGRLRWGLAVGGGAALALMAMLWLPGAVIRHAARVAQPVQRETIAADILTDLTTVTGPACQRPAGRAVLDRLNHRLTGGTARLVIVPTDLGAPRLLPGGMIVIGNDLLAGQKVHEVLAGAVLAAAAAAAREDPMQPVMAHAGFGAALRLLTRGTTAPESLKGYAAALLAAPPPEAPVEEVVASFAAHHLSTEPYARFLDPSGESVLELIEADPTRGGVDAKPVLSKGEWDQLRHICD